MGVNLTLLFLNLYRMALDSGVCPDDIVEMRPLPEENPGQLFVRVEPAASVPACIESVKFYCFPPKSAKPNRHQRRTAETLARRGRGRGR
jgi:hypothetical protein